MKTLGAVLILLLSSVALASPGGGGGGGGGGSHGGGGGGGGGHASAGISSHGGGAPTHGVSAVHPAATPASLARAGTPVARHTATAAKPPPKPGFWKRHFHFHRASAVPTTYGTLCSEEDRRLGRCPERAPQKR